MMAWLEKGVERVNKQRRREQRLLSVVGMIEVVRTAYNYGHKGLRAR
jgi:hypothetical protein